MFHRFIQSRKKIQDLPTLKQQVFIIALSSSVLLLILAASSRGFGIFP